MRIVSLILFPLLLVNLTAADWPQWRGPNRDGIALDAKLPAAWTDDLQPVQVWESEEIPSDHYGGHGSVSIADGKVYASVVWHYDEVSETRTLSSRVLSDLGYRGNDFSDELMAKFEEARMNLNPRLRGNSLKEWATEWTEENLNESQLLRYKGWVVSRFVEGKTAIPWADFEILAKKNGTEFENIEAYKTWLNEQEWADPATPQKVLAKTPNTKLKANNTVLCVSLKDGSTLWKFETPAHPSGRSSSSTPTVADGVVYALLAETLYAVDAATGEEIWRTETGTKRGVACSPLVYEGRVFVQTGKLLAVDAKDGKILWEAKEVSTTNSSPAIWRDQLICNGAKDLVGIDMETGEVKWTQPAGGDSTPVVSGDYCVVVSKAEGKSLSAFSLSPEGAREMWSKYFFTRRYGATPIIHDGHVYHLGSARHLCVDLETGETKWEAERQSNLSSPILADGKLLVFENNGGFLAMIDPSPEEHKLLGRMKVSALGCPSPAISGSLAVLRLRDKLVCYDLMGGSGAE